MGEPRDPITDQEYEAPEDGTGEAHPPARGDTTEVSEPPPATQGASIARHVTEPLGTVRPPLAPTQAPLLAPTQVPPLAPTPAWSERYEDQGEIARGGMSAIHRVSDRLMQRDVAMKVYDEGRDPTGLAHFAQEARITGRLDHPNIVPVHDMQQDGGPLPTRFTMKLVQGDTFAHILERDGSRRLDSEVLEGLLRIFVTVCDAVAFAHSRDVIHCDLKPSNVMVGSHGQVYVMDWGVAIERSRPGGPTTRGRGARGGRRGALSGTPAYMAPEQAWGRVHEIDARTDVYGLGGILYALLTLAPPHDGEDASHDLELARSGQVPLPTELVHDVSLPPGLCEIAMRCMEPEQEARYQTVEDLKESVLGFLRGGGWFVTVRFSAGELIVREGDPPDAAYIITAGECELYRESGGDKRIMGTLHTGDVFGETSIFGDTARTASVAAATDVTLVRVTREALTRELERTEWLRAFVEAVAQRFIERDKALRAIEDKQGG